MNPKVSIIVPVYNGVPFLDKLINSIINQTFKDWELIFVDDCSPDESANIINSYANKDERVKYYLMPHNTGSARMPILTGIEQAKSFYTVVVGQDDYLESNYLECVLKRQSNTGADIVVSTMCFFKTEGEVISTIPKADFDITRVFSGKEACSLTIKSWQISMNGALVPKSFYCICDKNEKSLMNLDEVDSRRLLLKANRVACCGAKYFYRRHSESITHKKSIKLFDTIETNRMIDEIILSNFGKDSEDYRYAVKHSWEAIKYGYIVLDDRGALFTREQRDHVINMVIENYPIIRSKRKFIYNLSLLDKILLKNYKFLFAYSALRIFVLKLIGRK